MSSFLYDTDFKYSLQNSVCSTNIMFEKCILLLAVVHFHSCIMLEKLKLLGETMSIFWSTGKTTKKIGPVSRQNKNNII